ncbi:hypothetical protein C4D60_Mb01t16690 [Musa balbisiana]|uniref:Uncharacterized protein n=1 Tax=Musa balbisiana TaxID=52838 RepID=A0A4S8JMP4_MUSBA|nr:hypothetical protein C4D60_Mb01t16690 [Musa balbisiana]
MEWIQSELLQPFVVEIIGLRNLLSSPPPPEAALLRLSDSSSSSSAPLSPFRLPSRVRAAVQLSQLSLSLYSFSSSSCLSNCNFCVVLVLVFEMLLTLHSDATVAKMLVGNKCDLENIRNISVDEGKSPAEAEGLFFIETSALDSTNVKKAFEIVNEDMV